MGFERSVFEPLMRDRIVVHAESTRNLWGQPSYAAGGSTYRARVVTKPMQVRDAKGQVIEVRSVAWVASTSVILASNRVTVYRLGSTVAEVSPIVGVERYPDQDGLHHVKILFGY